MKMKYLLANRGLATGVPGVCKADVGVVTVDADDKEPTDWATDQVLLLILPATWLEAVELVAVDELNDAELVAGTGPPEPVDDCSLDTLVKLASVETFEPSGTLLGTLNRLQSLTWSRHECSWTVMAQPN